MSSIRIRLFLILLAATGGLWLSAALWIQHSTRSEVQHVLDRRLQESARMVGSLIARQGGLDPGLTTGAHAAEALVAHGAHLASHQLICQVWGVDGRLQSESAGSPGQRLGGDVTGFSETTVRVEGRDEVWRVYTHVEPETGVRVMVGDARAMREGLVRRMILGLLAPALLILPLTAALIWWAVGNGLRPLEALARRLKTRPATDLSPLPDLDAPAELQPMLTALNGLFARVEGQRGREQDFTAFAAHELKTPLAGIKTQAQIAAIAPDAATRQHALRQIQRGVERTDRLVRQLLDMTATEAAPALAPSPDATRAAGAGAARQSGQRLLEEVTEGLRGLAQTRGVSLRVQPGTTDWQTSEAALLAPALKNLIENAVHASAPGAEVELALRAAAPPAAGAAGVCFEILDRGPGIAAEDRPRITERFYRGSRPQGQAGSGLGLAITAAAMARMGGRLELSPRPGGGEAAVIWLPSAPE